MWERGTRARFAVIDVETTGLSAADRILEVAVVLLDSNCETIDEYDTLINPQRDVGVTNIHGITASMVEAAPIFEEVAVALASRVSGSILVAHNFPFDRRMLAAEYARVGGVFDAGTGLCTLRLTGQKLPLACERYGVAWTAHHRALADARAAAQLLAHFKEEVGGAAAMIRELTCQYEVRTLRRETTGAAEPTPLRRLVSNTPYPTSNDAVISYLDALDRALDDRVINDEEWAQLGELANDLGLVADDIYSAKRHYLRALVSAAQRDGLVTAAEHSLISGVAESLRIVDFTIPMVTDAPRLAALPGPGARVCFTGVAIDADGNTIAREDLEALAAVVGLQPVASVTKKNCDLLVASDPSSASGKAKKARAYGIPVISVVQFLEQAN